MKLLVKLVAQIRGMECICITIEKFL